MHNCTEARSVACVHIAGQSLRCRGNDIEMLMVVTVEV